MDETTLMNKELSDLNEMIKREYTASSPFDANKVLSKLNEVSTKISKKIVNGVTNNEQTVLGLTDKEITSRELKARSELYQIYKDILKRMPQLMNAFRITAENVVSSEGVSNVETYKVITTGNGGDEVTEDDVHKSFMSSAIKEYKFNRKAYDKTIALMRDGDYFVEIIDIDNSEISNKDGALNSSVIITEAIKNTAGKDFSKLIPKRISENLTIGEFDSITEALIEDAKVNTQNDNDINEFSKVIVKKHNPRNVVKLQINDTCIGYIIVNFDEADGISSFSHQTSPLYNGVPISNDLMNNGGTFDATTGGNNPTNNIKDRKISAEKELTKSFATNIYNQIVKAFGEKENSKAIVAVMNNDPDIKRFVTTVLMSSSNIKLRFVKPEYMSHYMLPSIVEDETHYGEGVLYSLLFDIRTYLKLKSTYVNYLTLNAIEKMKIIVNVDTEGDVENAVNAVISTFKEKEKALEQDLEETEHVGRAVNPFEKYYIPRIKGENPIDFETIASPSANVTMDDIKALREDIIEGIRVPSALLDSRNSSYHTSLSQESMSYAVTILELQMIIVEGDRDLVNKIHKIVKGEELNDKYKYQLNPPAALMNEAKENQVNSVRTVIDFVYEMYVDQNAMEKTTDMKKVNIAKELLPSFNWDTFDKIFEQDTIDFLNATKNLGKKDENNGGF